MQIFVKYFTLEILVKYFTFVALSKSRYTTYLSHLMLSQFSPQPSPPLALLSHPLLAPPSSAPPIIGSPFTGTTHHQLHIIDATFNSQVQFFIFLTFFRCSPSLFLLPFFPNATINHVQPDFWRLSCNGACFQWVKGGSGD